ncbi:RAD52 motif-containing protein 1 isoform X5 [Ambystoma mexicanum]|uniref:RAD52 motif-containing protein 1 isoform X5 n=1 Tax=Ambystoma mexicanum TaxID=8296 RepID=UPI0037E9AC45
MATSVEIIEFRVPTENNKTLFVWNITARMSEEETYIYLMKIFSEFGLLYSIRVCRNAAVAEAGYYAIVKFFSSRDASRAQIKCDKQVLFQEVPLKVRLCTKQKGYLQLGRGLNSVKCQDVANHYLGFNGWSKRIVMIQNISGFEDMEEEDAEKGTEAEPDAKSLKYLSVIEIQLHKHGLCSRGVGVAEEKLQNPNENGKVAAEYSSVREDAVDCLSEEELQGLIQVNDLSWMRLNQDGEEELLCDLSFDEEGIEELSEVS